MNISPTLLIILLFVVIGTASSAAIAIFILVPLSRARQQNRQLLENGHPAIAEALSVRQTGLLVNNMPQVRMGLRVHPPDSAPFTLELVRVLAFTAIPKYVEGAVIDVRYDPAKPETLAVVGLAKPTPPPTMPFQSGPTQ